MRVAGFALIVCAAAAFAVGCGLQNGQQTAQDARGGTAVIDLDSVAKRLGRDVEINEAVQKKQTELNEQLALLRDKLNIQFNDARAKYGDELTPEQEKELQSLQGQMAVQLTQAQRKAQLNLEVFKQTQISRFREDVKPIAHNVAVDSGFTTVVPKNDSFVFTFEPSVDITNLVVEKMKTSSPTKVEKTAAVPSPKANTN